MKHYRSLRYFAFTALLVGAFETGRLTSLPSVVEAQAKETNQSIRVDNVNLTLGMAETQAIARFGDEYKLDPLGETGRVIQKKPTDPTGMYYQVIGTLVFTNGRLARVTKSWVSDQQRFESFWNGLFGSISNIAGAAGSSRATVTTKEISEPNTNTRLIVLTLEGRDIKISRVEQYETPNRTFFSVDEIFPPWPSW